ncbi:serine protease, partial [Myxococcota bacterium]|nr:serine protease [Myxococcota bacterium]
MNVALRRAPLALALFTAACGGSSEGPVAEDVGGSDSAVIIGSIDWSEITALDASSAARINSRSVGYVELAGSRCTGFLVTRDVVMTNQHCVPAESSAAGARVYFRREAGVAVTDWASYDCSTFVGNDRDLDYALLRCAGSPGDVHGVVALDARRAVRNESIYVIH